MDKKDNQILPYLSLNIRKRLKSFEDNFWDKLTNIRINVNSPVILELGVERCYLSDCETTLQVSKAYFATPSDIADIYELITASSAYAYAHSINEGYVTLPGGNRVGVSGNCSMEGGKIKCVKEIYAFNFRIAHEILGVSELILSDIYVDGDIKNTLIISPPGCGKTTMLRDIARSLGSFEKIGKIKQCAIIDERNEIACLHNGTSQMDIGANNFVISNCLKSVAVPIVARSMSPDVIVIDEMCDKKDFDSALYAKQAGCKIVASVHGKDEFVNEMNNAGYRNFFDTTIILSNKKGPGTIEKIITGG